MGMAPPRRLNPFHDPIFHRQHRLARRQADAIGKAEHMGVHRAGLLAKQHVHHHVRRLAAYAGQGFQQVAAGRHLPAIFVHQQARQGDDVLGLGIEQPDGADMLFQALLAQIEHLLRRVHRFKQAARGLVHPHISGLG